jgi:hypothetical protein
MQCAFSEGKDLTAYKYCDFLAFLRPFGRPHNNLEQSSKAARSPSAFSAGGFMRSCLLYLIGVPIPVIIVIWLLTGHA